MIRINRQQGLKAHITEHHTLSHESLIDSGLGNILSLNLLFLHFHSILPKRHRFFSTKRYGLARRLSCLWWSNRGRGSRGGIPLDDIGQRHSLLMLVLLHGRRLQSFKEGGDHSLASLHQCRFQSVHHGRGTGGVATDNNITTVGKTLQRINIGLMGMSRKRIDKEDHPAQIFHTHQCRNLRISAEGTGSTGQPIMNGGVILPPH
mmetsp:Transcript_17945/g.25433  ORF Transcript_17945/g.25433 Transcript_17945/m.25433 type:complete len:205 (+) Transcript_17945:263-877(+)